MMNELPLPPMIAQPDELLFNDVEDAALELYKRAAEAEAQTEKAVRTVRAEMVEQMRSAHRLIATLAAERFEFDRLMARIAPELERRNSNDLLQFLVLFKRSWELRMRRASIEVVDLTGQPVTDELAGDVEVESHVPDPSVAETRVRETLIPLVLLGGRSIGMAKIVTSVPVPVEEREQ
jgi:hypothetical protein